jgi:hypothetical protein
MPLLPPKCYKLGSVPQLIFLPLFSPLDLHLNLLRNLGCIDNFLTLEMFWMFQILSSLPFWLSITWWPPNINYVSILLLWFTQYSYYPLELSFILDFFPKWYKCCWVLHILFITWWPLGISSISCFVFVTYTIFILSS